MKAGQLENHKFILIEKIITVSGLIIVLSYTIVTLAIWASANVQGYVYYQAGEPVLAIKYFEWGMGLLGVVVCCNQIRKELDYYKRTT